MGSFFNRIIRQLLLFFFFGFGGGATCGPILLDQADIPWDSSTETFLDTDIDTDSEIDSDVDSDSDSDTDADGDTGSEGDSAICTDSNATKDTASADTGTGFDTVSDTSIDADADSDSDSDADSDSDSDSDVDSDSDSDVDSDSDGDSDSDTGTDTDADSDPDSDLDSDTDTDTGSDSDSDGDSDTGSDTAFTATPVLIIAVSDPEAKEANPSFTDDRLELYFNSTRAGVGSSDIWVSKRASTADPWGAPELVAELSTIQKDSTPKVSSNGLVLWFSSERDGCVGALDIWVSTRATRTDPWATPTCVSELNSPEADSGAAADASMLTLVLTSKRTGSSNADLYWTTHDSIADPWAVPMLIPGPNTAEDDEDGQLIQGGLKLYFASSGRAESTDLYVATRSSPSEDFGAVEPLTELNSASAFRRWSLHRLLLQSYRQWRSLRSLTVKGDRAETRVLKD